VRSEFTEGLAKSLYRDSWLEIETSQHMEHGVFLASGIRVKNRLTIYHRYRAKFSNRQATVAILYHPSQ